MSTKKIIIRAEKAFIFIILTVVTLFFVLPFFDTSLALHVAMQTCFVVLIVSTLYVVCNEKLQLWIGTLIGLPFIFFDFWSIFTQSLNLMLVAYGFYALFMLYIIVIFFGRLILSQKADFNIIFAAITIYLFSGIFWAKLYFITDALMPGSFNGFQNLYEGKFVLAKAFENHFNTLYFSFTTLATLGLGDIYPKVHLAKSLVMLEAIFGQLFVATVIAKTVSVWRND